jgi:tetratricopeptide (TPR) repeat protein
MSDDAKAIFLAAVERVSPTERAAFLDGACAGNPELRAHVEALLASHEEAGSFLEPLVSPSRNDLGLMLFRLRRLPEAEVESRAAAALSEKLVAEFPAVHAYAVGLGGSYCNVGLVVEGRGEGAAALDWYSKAIATLVPVHRAEPPHATGRRFLRTSCTRRAQVLMRLNRPAEAVADYDRALELDDGSARTSLRLGRAGALAQAGEAARALVAADEIVAVEKLSGGQLYDLACAYSLAAGAKTPLPPADGERAAVRAVDLLRQAFASGLRNVAHMLEDSDLDGLRGRPDYVELLWDLADVPH